MTAPWWSFLGNSGMGSIFQQQAQQSQIPYYQPLPPQGQQQQPSYYQPVQPAAPAVAQPAAPAIVSPDTGGANFASNAAKPVTGLTTTELQYQGAQLDNQPNQLHGNINAGVQLAQTGLNVGMGIFSMAKASEAFDWQKGMAEKNYWNSVKSYNTAMSDRIKSRYTDEQYAANQQSINSEIDKRKMNGKG